MYQKAMEKQNAPKECPVKAVSIIISWNWVVHLFRLLFV
jgi:hypothetical protein